MHLTHYRQSAQGVGSHLDYLGLVEDAREEGMDVTFDCYTYPYSGTTLVIMLPQWTLDGGPGGLKARLRDPAERARMRRRWRAAAGPLATPLARELADQLPAARSNKRFEGHSLAEIAERAASSPGRGLLDLLDEEGLGISTVGLGTNAAHPAGVRRPPLRHDRAATPSCSATSPTPAPTAASPSCWPSSSAPSATSACPRRSAR